jgi:hypothetical protein
MRGQGGGRWGKVLTAGFILAMILGCAMGLKGVVQSSAAQWRIADLFFDVALLVTLVYRGPALMRS